MQPDISEMHAMARLYASAGIAVFPCTVNGKRPVTENGFHDATTDLEAIDRWWHEKDYNLAFCPAQAGLFVIDIDPGADLSILDRLRPTYTVRTPRNGYHLYYEGVGKSTAGKLALHVDTRSVGGYVLVPPSVVDGVAYRVETDIEYTPLQAWVTRALNVVDAPMAAATEDLDLDINIRRATKLLRDAVEKSDVAIEGCGGDDRTYRMCNEVLDFGLSALTAHNLLDTFWNPHCVPPWDSEELALKIENALNHRQNEVGAYAVTPLNEAFGEAVKLLPKDEKPQKLSRFHFKDESEQDDEPDPTWLIKDLISERSTVMLYGQSGSYKSFLVLDICLSIAAGLPTFGSDTRQGLVFYGALEGKAHLKKARMAWRARRQIDYKLDNFFIGRAPMIAIEDELQQFGDQITQRCAGRQPALIVIDTLSKAMAGLNENDAQDANRYVTFCDSLVEHFGCSVLSVHHSSDKSEGRGARGSSALFAGFDTVIEVTAHKASKAATVKVTKQKDAEEREAPWTFEGQSSGPSLTFVATTSEQHALLTGKGDTVTPKTVGASLKALGAFGEDAAVSTTVLATHVVPAMERESIEDRAENIARTSRALTALAKNLLEGYCVRKGRNLFWYLP